MKLFLKNFKNNKFYLSIYLSTQSLILFSCVVVFYRYLNLKHLSLGIESMLYFVPLAFVAGIKIPTVMHNCFHDNYGKRSFILGELTSVFVLLSYGLMCINHCYHHVHADTNLDPHNPNGKSFINFLFTSSLSGVNIIEKAYLKAHDPDLVNRALFKFNIVLHLIGIPLRIAFWFFLLGQDLFLFLYVPAFSVYLFSFAHVNYVTHAKDKNGQIQILNIDSNIWYKFVNFFGDGVYFHKNHHHNPGLLNPLTQSRTK